MDKALCVVIFASLVCAYPRKENDAYVKRGINHWKLAMTASNETLGRISKGRIRYVGAKLKNDVIQERDNLKNLASVAEPINSDMKIADNFLKSTFALTRTIASLNEDFSNLPEISADNINFLDDCFKVNDAEVSDRDFLNDVLRRMVTCAQQGFQLLMKAVDIDHITDSDLTVNEVVSRLRTLKEVAQEISHLGRLLVKIELRIEENDFDKTSIQDLIEEVRLDY